MATTTKQKTNNSYDNNGFADHYKGDKQYHDVLLKMSDVGMVSEHYRLTSTKYLYRMDKKKGAYIPEEKKKFLWYYSAYRVLNNMMDINIQRSLIEEHDYSASVFFPLLKKEIDKNKKDLEDIIQKEVKSLSDI